MLDVRFRPAGRRAGRGQSAARLRSGCDIQYLMYYAGGSFMDTSTMHFILSVCHCATFLSRAAHRHTQQRLKSDSCPLSRPSAHQVRANQVQGLITIPNLKKHFALLEQYLETSPGGGNYLCGSELTGVDIMLAHGLQAGSITGYVRAPDDLGEGSFQGHVPQAARIH